MSASDLGFTHRFVPGTGEGDGLTLLALHGTGGDEHDLLPIGRALFPGAALLSPRGKVLENGAPRYFRRLAEGVFDRPDVIMRTHQLARFIEEAATVYAFNPDRVAALGFSNGANIAASLLLLEPTILAGAVLLRPMVPLVPDSAPNLRNKPVFIAAGRRDPIVTQAQSEELAALLSGYGAEVVLHWQDAGHSINSAEISVARTWLTGAFGPH